MRESIKQRRLRLWKARQIAAGYDVSKVTTLEEAEHFFDNKPIKEKINDNKQINPAGEPPVNPDDTTSKNNEYASMSWQELQELGKSFGLKVTSVKKADLIEEIEKAKVQSGNDSGHEEPPVNPTAEPPAKSLKFDENGVVIEDGQEEQISVSDPTTQLTPEQLAAMNVTPDTNPDPSNNPMTNPTVQE